MKNLIVISMFSLFGIAMFSSYIIVKNKVKREQPSFVITKKEDLDTKTSQKIISNYNPEKQYYWKYKIQKTYHSKGMSIYTSSDTLSRVLMIEDK